MSFGTKWEVKDQNREVWEFISCREFESNQIKFYLKSAMYI